MKKILIPGLILVAAITLMAASCSKPANPTTNLAEATSVAEWLTKSGVKMYGAWWCPHCADQKKIFGTAFEKINYIECATPDGKAQTQVCIDAKISSYPTWEFKPGDRVEGVQTLDQLKAHSNYPDSTGPPPPST